MQAIQEGNVLILSRIGPMFGCLLRLADFESLFHSCLQQAGSLTVEGQDERLELEWL